MKYVCGGIVWDSYEMASEYANYMFQNEGFILGIERLVE